jgi:hypothetical protein
MQNGPRVGPFAFTRPEDAALVWLRRNLSAPMQTCGNRCGRIQDDDRLTRLC